MPTGDSVGAYDPWSEYIAYRGSVLDGGGLRKSSARANENGAAMQAAAKPRRVNDIARNRQEFGGSVAHCFVPPSTTVLTAPRNGSGSGRLEIPT